MKIGIIGGGTVGRAVARTYLEWADEVRVYDRVKELNSHWHPDHQDLVHQADIIFICLPESSLDHYLGAIPTLYLKANYVLKSTVPVGTTRRLREKYGLVNLIHSPEFLTARCAETDARIPAFNVLGFAEEVDEYFFGKPGYAAVYNLYKNRFLGTPIIRMKSEESETLKASLNSWFAVKVAFFNELYAYCQAAGLDYETVRAGILADGRTTAHHTRVPGPDGKFGFGGGCLPKDLEMMGLCMAEAGVIPVMLSAAKARNATDRGKGV